jgi:hypothetical protein
VALFLTPSAGKYHVHEPITLTAHVLDVYGALVPGVTVKFDIWGGCRIEPRKTQRTAVSDVHGIATIRLRSLDEGTVFVGAAARNDAMRLVYSRHARLRIVGDYNQYGETEQVDRYAWQNACVS